MRIKKEVHQTEKLRRKEERAKEEEQSE